MIKSAAYGIIAGVGGFLLAMVGGWDEMLKALLVFMAADYISGLILAGRFHKSPKTETGGLSSRIGLQGLGRKCLIMLMVVCAVQLDKVLGTTIVRSGVIIAFCANELLSVVENVGAMGLPIPKAIAQAIELLRQKSEVHP